jgi:hypothetical protein
MVLIGPAPQVAVGFELEMGPRGLNAAQPPDHVVAFQKTRFDHVSLAAVSNNASEQLGEQGRDFRGR